MPSKKAHSPRSSQEKRRREKVPGFTWKADKPTLVKQFLEAVCVHTKDSPTAKAGDPIKLLDWHISDVIEPLYGWQGADGRRRFRVAYIEVPKKNAKSTLLSCLSIWHLLMEGQGELGCIAAKDRNQAAIIFDETAAMVKRSPELKSVLEVIDSRKTIYCATTDSSLRVISRDAGAAEGPSYSFVFCDELHAWPDRRLFEALRYSGRSRPAPLLATITTAGDRRDTICWEQHEYAEQVIADPKYDPRFYGKIFAAKADGTEDYFDPAVWRRCNPGMGITMTEDSFAADAQEARNKSTKLNGWLRYSLGVWVESSQRFIDPEKWAACSEPPTEPLAGRRCIIGMDLSKSTDLSACVALFPNEDGTFDVDPMFWAPRDLIMERERTDRQPFQHWVNQGSIKTTDGNVIDHAAIREYVLEYAKTHQVQKVLMDITGAVQLSVELQGAGLDVESYGQGFRHMSSPTKLLESLTLQQRIRHSGNPVLSWMAGCVTVESNAFEDIRPVKKKSTGRIDGIVALIFALGYWEANSITNANGNGPEIFFI
jgi:phage terminase large subunit-like protein